MSKDAALIAQHRRPALLTALFIVAALTLFGCDEQGVDVTLVGIPADTEVSVSVDSLRQDIAAAPSKVYRYRGVGYAKVLGLVGAPSYTATVRRLDGCVIATGSAAYQGEEEVRIDLVPVDGCKMPVAAAPDLARPDMAPSDMVRRGQNRRRREAGRPPSWWRQRRSGHHHHPEDSRHRRMARDEGRGHGWLSRHRQERRDGDH